MGDVYAVIGNGRTTVLHENSSLTLSESESKALFEATEIVPKSHKS